MARLRALEVDGVGQADPVEIDLAPADLIVQALVDHAVLVDLVLLLRLEVEALRSPDLVEKRAMRELGMVYPAPEHTLVIERVSSSTAPRAIVASAR